MPAPSGSAARVRAHSYLRVGHVVLLLILALAGQAAAIEAQCSACKAVARELAHKINQEEPQGDLDLRNRLDPNGKRQGKYVPYAASELRVHHLVDDLCDYMTKYKLDAEDGEAKWSQVRDKVDMNRVPEAERDDAKRLTGYCHRILGDNEEEVSESIRGGRMDAAGAMSATMRSTVQLCMMITEHCSGGPAGVDVEKVAAAAQEL
ncbi:unnamed protein product [Pedinophyceae sp. YPF-701]|nr:unnamed protein product [Pedinophyceae sp. YPF-701]